MADSSSQNSDSSNASSQNFSGSYFPNSQYPHMAYHQQQIPYNFQNPSNYTSNQYPSNIQTPTSILTQQYSQHFAFNSPGGSSFPQQYAFSSPTGVNVPQQFPSNIPSNYFMPPPNQYQQNSSQFPQHSSQVRFQQINLGDDDNDDEDVVGAQKVGKSTRKSKETKKEPKEPKASWTPDEDIHLVQAWYNTSTDSIIGTDQKCKDFWEKIAAYYNKWKPEGSADKTHVQIKNRYYKVNPDLNKWAAMYNNFWSNRASGQGDDDVLEAAKQAWRNDDENGKDFKFLHIWNVFQVCEKWQPQQMRQNPMKKAKGSETDSPSGTDSGPRVRPMGQQRAKRLAKDKAKTRVPADEDATNMWSRLQDSIQRQLSIEEDKLKLQHMNFITKDTSGMSEAELHNFHMMATDIKTKYGWM